MTSLHWKLAAVFAALLSLVTLSVLVLCLRSAERYGAEVRQELNREVAPQIAKDLQPFSDEELDKDALKSVFMKVMVVNPALEVYLLDDAGRVLAYDAPPEKVVRSAVDLAPVLRLLADPEGGLIEGDDPRNRTARKPFTAAAIEDEHGLRGYLYMIVGGEEYDSVAALLKQSHILRVLAWSAGGMLAMGLVAGALAFGWLTRPLRRLRVAMASFREGRPVPALHIESRDEIGALARTFEHLTRRISEHVDRLDRVDRERREFVANVSHDLRTPLASLQGYLDLLRDKSVELAPAQREEFVENARGRARHLERLIDQLFELARFDAGDVPVSLEEFQLAELVQDVLQENRIRAGARGVRLRCRMPHDLPVVVGDIGLIERALGNLLDNATRHTPRGGDVTVRLRTLADRVEVRVSDTGSGIPREEIDKVFDRTYQVDRSSQRGTGLGLAITRRILELHDAVIRVRSRVDEGTTFRFALPTA